MYCLLVRYLNSDPRQNAEQKNHHDQENVDEVFLPTSDVKRKMIFTGLSTLQENSFKLFGTSFPLSTRMRAVLQQSDF